MWYMNVPRTGIRATEYEMLELLKSWQGGTATKVTGQKIIRQMRRRAVWEAKKKGRAADKFVRRLGSEADKS